MAKMKMTKQDKLDALREQIQYHRNRLNELNPGRHGEEALTCFSLGWDHCLLFLSEHHGLDLRKL
jgi:hypothetical protein